MKYVVYILTAVLALAAMVTLIQFINMLSATPEIDLRLPDYRAGFWVNAVLMAAVAVMAVVQLFRSTPRLMLLFAGAAAYEGILLLVGQWVPAMVMSAGQLPDSGLPMMILVLNQSLLMMAAGLLPALYEWIRHGRLVKAQPKRAVKRGLLIAAGVLACVNLALAILRTVVQTSMMVSHDMALLTVLPPSIAVLLFDIGLLVFCFMMKRRTGALYRMFFSGPIALSAVTLPFTLVSQFRMGMGIDAIAANFVIAAVAILTAVFAIIHAAKHRHEDFAPPILPPPYDEPAASAAA